MIPCQFQAIIKHRSQLTVLSEVHGASWCFHVKIMGRLGMKFVGNCHGHISLFEAAYKGSSNLKMFFLRSTPFRKVVPTHRQCSACPIPRSITAITAHLLNQPGRDGVTHQQKHCCDLHTQPTEKIIWSYIGLSPCPVTVTTRIIICFSRGSL